MGTESSTTAREALSGYLPPPLVRALRRYARRARRPVSSVLAEALAAWLAPKGDA